MNAFSFVYRGLLFLTGSPFFIFHPVRYPLNKKSNIHILFEYLLYVSLVIFIVFYIKI